MTKSTEIVLVRHGLSVANIANDASRNGDESFFTPEYRAKADREHPLAEIGREQARTAGGLILAEFGCFDNFYVSPFVRARQTADLLGIPDAEWQVDPRLAERDWGVLSSIPHSERRARFPLDRQTKRDNELTWLPPGEGGETILQVLRRWQDFFDSIHEKVEGKRTLVVGHGELMLAVRAWITGMSDEEFAKLMTTGVSNTEMHHYSNVDPNTGEISPELAWMRTIAPTKPERNSDWERFKIKP